MGQAGVRFSQILAALTIAPAQHFEPSAHLGRILPGFVADLSILRNDPAKDIQAFAAVNTPCAAETEAAIREVMIAADVTAQKSSPRRSRSTRWLALRRELTWSAKIAKSAKLEAFQCFVGHEASLVS